MNDISISELRRRAGSIKHRFLSMYRAANAGHVGSSLSCAEIISMTFFGWMAKDDEFVLSKGHAAAALYACLEERGDIAPGSCKEFYRDGTLLAAHPPPGGLPGIRFATGSLGHGLSLAAGMALGDKMLSKRNRVFCLCSDGEFNEGSTWEAILFAAHHKLSRLVALIDRNRLQGFGFTEQVCALEPLSQKLESFGWRVLKSDGHDLEALRALSGSLLAEDPRGRPTVLICDTQKGRGMAELENTVGCHYLPMSEEIFSSLVSRAKAEAEGER